MAWNLELPEGGVISGDAVCDINGLVSQPFDTIAAANIGIPSGYRKQGLTCKIWTDSNKTTVDEYWYNGGTSDSHLVRKPILTNVSVPFSIDNLTPGYYMYNAGGGYEPLLVGSAGGKGIQFKVSEQNVYQRTKANVSDAWTAWSIIGSDGGGAGLIDYSLIEQNTGKRWVDGRPIYQKTLFFQRIEEYGSANTHLIPETIDDEYIEVMIVDIKPMIMYSGTWVTDVYVNLKIYVDPINNSFTLMNGFDDVIENIYVTVLYTKPYIDPIQPSRSFNNSFNASFG